MSQVIVSGTLPSENSLRRALGAFRRLGVRTHDISYVHSEKIAGHGFRISAHSKAPLGMIVGSWIGGLVLALMFASQADRTLPELWLYAISGFGVGSILGTYFGWLIGRRIPVYQVVLSGRDSKNDKEASLLLGVTVDDSKADAVQSVFEQQGASQVTKLDKRYEEEAGL